MPTLLAWRRILPVHDGSWLVAAGLFSFGAATLLIGENVIQPALVGGAARLYCSVSETDSGFFLVFH
jgi:hypothetical protein